MAEHKNDENFRQLQFLAQMSNEIRTPLNGINGMLEIMKEKHLVKDEHYLDMARESARYLTRVLNNVSELTRLECGQIELKPVYLMLQEVSELVQERVCAYAHAHQISVQKNYITNLYRYAYVDGTRVAQVLAAFLEDAMLRTPDGGHIELSVACTYLRENWMQIVFRIKDNGKVRTAEELEERLNPFQTAGGGQREPQDLELAIANRLISLMGGILHIDSDENTGTEVQLMIETQGATNLEHVRGEVGNAGVNQKMEELQLQNRRALIVEDNQINREIASALLKFVGLASDSVTNGAEAVSQIERMPENYYDVIFMDIRMPIMDGIEATRTIRNMKRSDTDKVAVVAMTSKVSDEDEHIARECGMGYMLAKPFDKQQLQWIVYEIFGMEA